MVRLKWTSSPSMASAARRPLLVGRSAEGDVVELARDGVIECGAVAGSVDVGDICLHGVGDYDGAVFELLSLGSVNISVFGRTPMAKTTISTS